MVLWNLHALRTACAVEPRYVLPFSDTCTLEPILEATDDGPSDDDRVILHPPPSASTTAFPTVTTTEFVSYNSSTLTYCATANAPSFAPTVMPTVRPSTAFPTSNRAKQVIFDADQVRRI